MLTTESVHYFTEDIKFQLPYPELTTTWIQSVIIQEGYQPTQLNFIFCSDAFLHNHNVQYLQHDTLTDVITFDYTDEPKMIEGDIYISIDRVQENAHTYGHSFEHELATVMVHGVLHLMGYTDKHEADKKVMREKEALYTANRPI